MSIRVASSSLISGAVVVGDPGLGVLGSEVPATGEHGGGIAATWLATEDLTKEVRVLITSWPATGTLFVYEDTSFEYDGESTTFEAQLYLDGVAVGSPQPVTLTIGADPVTLAPGGAVISVTGHSPAILHPITVAPTAGRIELSGNVPAVTQGDAQTIQPSSGRIELAGHIPGIAQPQTLAPDSGRLEITGQVPTIAQIATIRPSAGRIEMAGHSPVVQQPRTVEPASGRIELSGHAPIIVQGITIDPASGRIELLGGAPSIAQGGAVTLSPAAGRIVMDGGIPTVSTGAPVIDWSLRRRSVFVRMSRPGAVVRAQTQQAVVRI